ncbi:MAG: YlxR family protein [Eubacteriales bacterium]|nr:YlxR family protein [Eubacteriales bacterium]
MSTVKKIPMRKCVGCNEKKEKRELVRVLRTPEGEIILDTTGRANGRGAYICRNAECLKKAKKNRGLDRSFGEKISEEMFEKLSKEMSETEY